MIKNLRKIINLAFLLTIFTLPAKAAIKLAPANWASEIVNWISAKSEEVTMKVEPVAEKYQTLKEGVNARKESLENIKKVKERAEKAAKKAQDYKKKYDDIKGKVKDIYDKSQDLANKVKEHADDAKELYDKANVDVLKLKEDLKIVQKEHSDYVAGEKSRLSARVKVLEENNKQLENIIKEGTEEASLPEMQLKQNVAAIENLNKEIDGIEDNETSTNYKEQEENLQAQIDEKSEEIKQLALSLGGTAVAALGTALGSMALDSGAAYNEVKESIFIKDNEDGGGDALGRIEKNRKVIAAKDTISAYVTALKVKNNIKDREEWLKGAIEGDSSSGGDIEGVNGSDNLIPVIRFETREIRTIAMRNLLDSIKLMVADMKMTTANDVLYLPFAYDHREQFSFDDFVFTKEDATGQNDKKRSKLEKLKDTFEAGEDIVKSVKEDIDTTVSTVNDVKDSAIDTKNNIEETISTVEGEGNNE